MQKRRTHKKHSLVIRLFYSFFRRLVCHRNIIVISEHKTDHIPVGIATQLAVVISVLSFVVWASYSTGNYMAAQHALKEKERKIASTSLENRRIESEFALLKRDLIKLIEEDNSKEPSEYAKFVIEQYKNSDKNDEDVKIDLSQLGSMQHGAVFERIAFLEQTVDALKENHEAVLESIRATAHGKLGDLESIIKTTGLSPIHLEKQATTELPAVGELANKDDKPEDHIDNSDDAPRGGPYDPLTEKSLLEQEDSSLYQDLQRLNLLSDVVEALPLAEPMAGNFEITSGFGMRIDPFRKRLALHTGEDFSGPVGARVYSTNDGIVKSAGIRGAYGNSIEVEHPFGVSTLYGHLSRIMVEEGDQVHKGQVIGIQGSTGRSTGAHLHYEVRYNGAKLNPAYFLKAGQQAGLNNVRKVQN